MFGFIIRPFRAIGRSLGRVSIEKREQGTLSDTRKVLLTFRAARENSKAQVGLYRERVARLQAALQVEQSRPVEKRAFDWVRFDQNTLMTAIKDDLYEAEKKLHEELANYESNDAQVCMFEAREVRLVGSLEARRIISDVSEQLAQADDSREVLHVTGVDYDPANGRIDLVPNQRVEADVAAGRNPLRVPRSDAAPGQMLGVNSKRVTVAELAAVGVPENAIEGLSVTYGDIPDRRETIAEAAAQAVARNTEAAAATTRQHPSSMGGLVSA